MKKLDQKLPLLLFILLVISIVLSFILEVTCYFSKNNIFSYEGASIYVDIFIIYKQKSYIIVFLVKIGIMIYMGAKITFLLIKKTPFKLSVVKFVLLVAMLYFTISNFNFINETKIKKITELYFNKNYTNVQLLQVASLIYDRMRFLIVFTNIIQIISMLLFAIRFIIYMYMFVRQMMVRGNKNGTKRESINQSDV